MDVGDREVRARLVGRPAELASDHHAFNSPRRVPERAEDLDQRAREVARKSIMVEENSAKVVGDDKEVLCEGTISTMICGTGMLQFVPRLHEGVARTIAARLACSSLGGIRGPDPREPPAAWMAP